MEIIGCDQRKFSTLLAEQYGGNRAIANIFSLVQGAGCKTIIKEIAPPDECEYKSEYEVFFKKCLATEDQRSVERLHFFVGEVATVSEVQNADPRYLGYCDVRPIPNRTVSGALVDVKAFHRDNKGFLYVTCQRDFEVQFGAKKLAVKAFPYTQQDGAVLRCAQASVISIAKFLNKTFTSTDLTKLLQDDAFDGDRILPSGGMTPRQIGICLEALGYSPVFFDASRDIDPTKDEDRSLTRVETEQEIYHYIESRIPALIVVRTGRAAPHSLVVIGHTFTPDSWLAQSKTSYYGLPKTGDNFHCSTNWVEKFVVMDDNLGPYMLVPSDFLRYVACELVVVPLHQEAFMLAHEAERFVASLLDPGDQDFCQYFNLAISLYKDEGKTQHGDTTYWYQEFSKYAHNRELVLRTSLRESSKWQKEIEQRSSYGELRESIKDLPFPEYVWVTEISWPNIFTHTRKLCGEVVLDATCVVDPNVPTLEQAWIWAHVPGVYIWRNTKTGQSGSAVLSADPLCGHHAVC